MNDVNKPQKSENKEKPRDEYFYYWLASGTGIGAIIGGIIGLVFLDGWGASSGIGAGVGAGLGSLIGWLIDRKRAAN